MRNSGTIGECIGELLLSLSNVLKTDNSLDTIRGTLCMSQYFVFERRLTDSLRLSCPLPVIGQLELM